MTSFGEHLLMTAPDRVRPVRTGDLVLPTEALAWLLHPITVGALALLLLNDHLLKAAWPGVVTGKLSDFAGLALTPPAITAVLALLLPRLPVRKVAGTATLIVGIGFCLVKVTVLGAAWASAGWSWAAGPSTVLRDPTDLLALPALSASWWALAQVRRHPLPGRAASLVFTAIVLPIAGLAILATTPAPYPSANEVIVQDGPKLVVLGSDMGESDAIVTTDGDSWSNLPDSEVWRPPGVDGSTQKACVPADPSRCYRIVPGRLAVEQTDDGGATWKTAWSISPGRQKFLARAHPDYGMGVAHVAAQSLGVLPVGDQHVVVVAAWDESVILRHPDGRWERIGYPTLGHLDLGNGPTIAPAALTDPGQRIAIEYAYLALGLSGGLLLGGMAASSRRSPAWWVIPLVTVGFSYFIVLVSRMGALLGVLSSIPAVLTLITIALLLWLTILWSTGTLTFTRAVVFAALVVIAFALDRRPIVEWSSGQIDSYEAAVRTATQLVAGSVIAMTLVGLAFRVRDHVRPRVAPIPATGRKAG